MNSAAPCTKSFAFEKFKLSKSSQILLSAESEVHLPKRPFQILVYLIENRERVVSRDELLEIFWDGHDVYDDALRKAVGAIRKAIGDLEKPPKFIETRWGSGYHFIAKVEESEVSEELEKGTVHRFVQNKTNSVLESRIAKDSFKNFRYLSFSMLLISLVSLLALGFYGLRRSSNGLIAADDKTSSNHSIAVLQLKNLTGDSANDFLSDGITESLITELSRFTELRVISRSSSFSFKEKETSPEEIGQ